MNETSNIPNSEVLQGGILECRCDSTMTLIRADDSLLCFLGINRDRLGLGEPVCYPDCIYIEDRHSVMQSVKRQLCRNRVFMAEHRIVAADGRLRWIHISGERLKDGQGSPFLHCIFHDVTEIRNYQERLDIEGKLYEIILSQTQDIIFELDCRTRDIYYSPTFEKKFGYQIPVKGFPDSVFATDIVYQQDKQPLKRCFQSMITGKDRIQCEYRLKHRDGLYLWVSMYATAIRDQKGNLLKIAGIISDINEQKEEILKAQNDARLDPLTSLQNRRDCIRRVEAYTRSEKEMGALILIDIDNFKMINDTRGHLFGDKVLITLADILRSTFRRNDVTARIGGDEFIVFMPHIHGYEDVVPKLESIRSALEGWRTADEEDGTEAGAGHYATFSIGVSLYPDHGSDFASLFDKADTAMYHAKHRGKNQYSLYMAETPDERCPDTQEPVF